MKRTLFVLFAVTGSGLLQAQQTVTVEPKAFYQSTNQNVGGIFLPVRLNAPAVAGSPFSAMQEQHILQILGDGTRIERTETSQVNRDSQGRTRTESSHVPGEEPSEVIIQDPVAGARTTLRIATRSAIQVALPRGRVRGGDADAGINIIVNEAKGDSAKPVVQDLGVQTTNGVSAKGTRTTLTIPVGQIGNDRPIQVVSERWYSDDLQMVVKSSNSDPRFGTTEFNLKNILRIDPDPALFQIPPDYTQTKPSLR